MAFSGVTDVNERSQRSRYVGSFVCAGVKAAPRGLRNCAGRASILRASAGSATAPGSGCFCFAAPHPVIAAESSATTTRELLGVGVRMLVRVAEGGVVVLGRECGRLVGRVVVVGLVVAGVGLHGACR